MCIFIDHQIQLVPYESGYNIILFYMLYAFQLFAIFSGRRIRMSKLLGLQFFKFSIS
jgi:hypothetical protein